MSAHTTVQSFGCLVPCSGILQYITRMLCSYYLTVVTDEDGHITDVYVRRNYREQQESVQGNCSLFSELSFSEPQGLCCLMEKNIFSANLNHSTKK